MEKDYQYPRLVRVFDHYNKIPHDVGNLFLVCCQHIMEPQMRMFECLIKFGFNPRQIFVLGKAYSTNDDVLKELKGKGIQAMQPKFSGASFDEEHKKNCEGLLRLIPESAECIILDDGADLIKTFARNNRGVRSGIEQTSSGFRRLENERLPFPVINVARSVTKLTQESPLVARHLSERILNYLKNHGVTDPKILVVGLGPIGESILKVLQEEGVAVDGFDIKHGHKNLPQKIYDSNFDVVIGATGNSILTKEDIGNIPIRHKLFLISASSSDREFPVKSFRSDEKVHSDVVYKNITFVNNGFPLSFMGNRYEMTPIEIEKTICLLEGSVIYGATRNLSESGLIDLPAELENIINTINDL